MPEQKMKSDHFYDDKLLKDMETEISENSPVSTVQAILLTGLPLQSSHNKAGL
jgi:hypothetical protein